MSRLLPREPPVETADEPLVVDVAGDDADEVLSVVSSETARSLLVELFDSPATQSTLADRVDTSIQNVDYHLDRLEAVGLVEAVGEWYSEKGRAMDVYAPAGKPLVLVAGDGGRVTDLGRAIADDRQPAPPVEVGD